MKRIEEVYESTVVERDEHRKSKEYKKLSPRMKAAVDDVYNMIDKASDPIIGKIEGIISKAAKKHGINVSSIERYIDTEIIK